LDERLIQIDTLDPHATLNPEQRWAVSFMCLKGHFFIEEVTPEEWELYMALNRHPFCRQCNRTPVWAQKSPPEPKPGRAKRTKSLKKGLTLKQQGLSP
jgi:hypothetical protein